ncbi:glycoside hydrolase family protein [Paraburkholderia sp. LEh10]|jgi:lysozyme|uniref:lysozyme n=1 Tax=Paraburkholderia sp. LEh10 TaxID=2821353 RepID=UPI001AEA86BE|nr:glycoside hydrolase family protein [Paraburkholderia sp. LEh10]MBP0593852.1 glycoside hydrolase family protein [Paraburkholderia sp. LEh10]
MPTTTTHCSANPPTDANANLSLSAEGQRALQQNEGLRRVYYNDTANNCTFGVGSLAHMGPCTARELGQPVPDSAIRAQLATGIRRAEQIVRNAVPGQALTQEQFDAAVSFAYNVPGGARAALNPANRGDMAAVARNMNDYVYVHAHDAHGRPVGPPLRSDGLVSRRRREAAPFLASPPAPASALEPASGATP